MKERKLFKVQSPVALTIDLQSNKYALILSSYTQLGLPFFFCINLLDLNFHQKWWSRERNNQKWFIHSNKNILSRIIHQEYHWTLATIVIGIQHAMLKKKKVKEGQNRILCHSDKFGSLIYLMMKFIFLNWAIIEIASAEVLMSVIYKKKIILWLYRAQVSSASLAV